MNNADTTTAATPKLWNPNAAANLSLLFSPILGAWLHAKNWKELGQHDRAKKSMIWVYIGFVFQLVNLFLPDNLGYGPALIFLFAWYFSSGKGQVKYLKENNINYEKKAWGKPLLLGLAGWAAYFVVVVGFVLIAEPSSNEVLESESVSIVTHQERAAAGDATAQWQLGSMYLIGKGVPQDYAEAVKWFRKAAEQGFADAQFILGVMYTNGEGVPKDDAEAVKWYRKAAEQGNADAQFILGVMYTNGSGVPKDDAEAVKWYRKAAEQGNADAQYNLGTMYTNGSGVPQDNVKAYMFFNLAAAQGDKDAEKYREQIGEKMTQEQIAEGQKLTREWLERNGLGQ